MALGKCEHKPCSDDALLLLGVAKRRLCGPHAVEALFAIDSVRGHYSDLEVAAGKLSLSGKYKAVCVVALARSGPRSYGAWLGKAQVVPASELAAALEGAAADLQETEPEEGAAAQSAT